MSALCRRRTVLIAATASALIATGAVGGVALSAPQGPDGLIHACFDQAAIDNPSSGFSQVVVVNAGAACPTDFPNAMPFNQVGPQGPAGPTGPQGPSGTDGTTGATGATGPQAPISATPQAMLTKRTKDQLLKQDHQDGQKAVLLSADLGRLRSLLLGLDNSPQSATQRLAQDVARLTRIVDQINSQTRNLAITNSTLVKNVQ